MPTENFKWNRELVSELILNYEMYPVLYDPRHPDYINRVKKCDAYDKVLEAMVSLDPNISLEIIKKKWHTLRGQFVKEFREIESSKKSGAGTDDLYEPKLWCFQQMVFLKTHTKIRNSTSNIEENERKRMPSCSNEDFDAEADESEEELHVTPKKKRKTDISAIEKKIMNMKQVVQKKMENKSQYSWLGKQVVFELDNIKNESIRRKTSWAIQNILREGVEEDLQLRNNESTHTSYTSYTHSGCSSFSSRQYSSSNQSSSKDCSEKVRILSVEEIRPASSQSDVARTSFTPDLLEQSMADIFYDEDFY